MATKKETKEMNTTVLQAYAVKKYKEKLEECKDVNNLTNSRAIDCIFEKDGQIHYHKVKATIQKDTYFGGTSITTWRCAIEHPETFRFVIAILNDKGDDFTFKYIKPEEMFRYCYIPPFRVHFNLNLENIDELETKGLTAINDLIQIYKEEFGTLPSYDPK